MTDVMTYEPLDGSYPPDNERTVTVIDSDEWVALIRAKGGIKEAFRHVLDNNIVWESDHPDDPHGRLTAGPDNSPHAYPGKLTWVRCDREGNYI